MKDYVLSFLGAVIVYAGYLSLSTDRTLGLAAVLFGSLICLKPLVVLMVAPKKRRKPNSDRVINLDEQRSKRKAGGPGRPKRIKSRTIH